jgi:phage baseplate assembly protein W
MTDFEPLFGADLRLLGNLLYAEQRERGSDLFVAIRPASSRIDLQRVTGVENLQQALLVRFLTQVGELEALGHPSYGSRLHELVGELNTETTRNRAKLFALQALQAEPRIAQVRSVVVETDRRQPALIEIKAAVVTIEEPTTVNLVFGVNLAGAA